MLTTIFSLLLEVIIRISKVKREETILKNEHQRKAFADNLAILIQSKNAFKRIIRKEGAQMFVFKINQKYINKYWYLIMGYTWEWQNSTAH